MSEPLFFSLGNSSIVCLYLYAFEVVKTLKMSTTNTMMIEIIKVSNIQYPSILHFNMKAYRFPKNFLFVTMKKGKVYNRGGN